MAALAVLPRAAQAQGGFLDFMENLSGPGPFNYGFAFDARVACRTSFVADTPAANQPKDRNTKDEENKNIKREWVGWFQEGTDRNNRYPCLAKPKTVQSYIELRYAKASSDDRSLFADQPNELQGHVSATAVQALMMRQIDPAISVGAGVGGLWISGPTIQGKVFRPIVTPISVALTPLKIMGSNAWWARLVVFRFDENAVFKALDASDFNTASNSKFVAHADMVRTFAITFDVAAVVEAVATR